MKASWVIVLLASLTALFGGVAAGAGFFLNKSSAPRAFTTLRGLTVQMYGKGLYQFDTLFFGAGYKGQDAAALFLGVPLLIGAILLYQRGSLSGHLLLAGMLGYFLYLYASMALGAAYNPLFLVYAAAFAFSLFGFILTFNAAVLRVAGLDVLAVVPGRAIAVFMFIAGGVTLFVWGSPLVSALIQGAPPARLDSYTTMVTYALDLAVITPAVFICGALLLQGHPSGVVLAAPLLLLIILLAPQIILSTVFQLRAGVPFTTGEVVGPVAGFVVLGIAAFWLLVRILQGISRLPKL